MILLSEPFKLRLYTMTITLALLMSECTGNLFKHATLSCVLSHAQRIR